MIIMIEKTLILFAIFLSLFLLIVIYPSITGFQIPPTCGNGICEEGETPENCPQDCGPICGDGICDPGEEDTCPEDCVIGPVCGNGFCEEGETPETCPEDCGEPKPPNGGVPGGNGGGPPPEEPSEEPEAPPEIEPPSEEEILEFPEEIIEPPSPGETIDLPEGGITIQLEPNIMLALYPITNLTATIHNITKIEPGRYKLLLCNQTSVASYEINVTADLAFFCANYSGYGVEDPDVFIFKSEENDWIPLGIENIIIDTNKKVICGNITSTPYMIAGFLPTPLSKTALDAIKNANNSIRQAREQGMNTKFALSLLDQAFSAYYRCDWISAKSLADRAMDSLVVIPASLIFIILILATGIWYRYYILKKKVAIKIRRKK